MLIKVVIMFYPNWVIGCLSRFHNRGCVIWLNGAALGPLVVEGRGAAYGCPVPNAHACPGEVTGVWGDTAKRKTCLSQVMVSLSREAMRS